MAMTRLLGITACIIQSHSGPPAHACHLICHILYVLIFEGVVLKVLLSVLH